jgi:hypothetical protein
MFDTAESQRPAETGAGVEYGQLWPVAPGATDPVRAAAVAEAIEDGVLVWDPAEEALFGPDPDVDVRAVFAALDAESADAAAAEAVDPRAVPTGLPQDVVDPRGLVPQRMSSVEDMAPGPELAVVLDQADTAALGAFELVEVIAGWQRLASWAAARQAGAILELSRRAEPVRVLRRSHLMLPTGLTAA